MGVGVQGGGSHVGLGKAGIDGLQGLGHHVGAQGGGGYGLDFQEFMRLDCGWEVTMGDCLVRGLVIWGLWEILFCYVVGSLKYKKKFEP